MRFEDITRELIGRAIELFNQKGLPAGFGPSLSYDLIVDDKAYPPKAIVAYAESLLTGENPKNDFSGGRGTDCFNVLEQHGYQVLPKIRLEKLSRFIEEYKLLISGELPDRAYNELYKWELFKVFQERWPETLTSDNISGALDQSFSSNSNSILGGGAYYPLSVLKEFAADHPERVAKMFQELFDESKELTLRMQSFQFEADELLKGYPDKGSHYQDDRSIMVYLALRFPEKYFLYKYGMYRDFCKKTQVVSSIPGKTARNDFSNAINFLELANSVKDDLLADEELMRLHQSRLPEGAWFEGEENLFVQDFIYACAQYLGSETSEDSQRDKEQVTMILKAMGESEAKKFFDLMNRLIEKLGVTEGDERLTFSLPKSPMLLGLTIGQRYAFVAHLKDQNVSVGYINSLEENEEWWEEAPSCDLVEQDEIAWIQSATAELNRTNKSGFRRWSSGYLEDVVFHLDRQAQLFNEIFGAETMKEFPLNQILFGPPGTGKTWSTIDAAVEIATGKSMGHRANKESFDELREAGQIEFITFHQSYAYEDFVVGVRPSVEEGRMIFEEKKGIFYEMCRKAKDNLIASKHGAGKRSFDDVIEEYIQPILRGEEIKVPLYSGGVFYLTDAGANNIRVRKASGNEDHTLSFKTLKNVFEGSQVAPAGLRSYYIPVVKALKELAFEGAPKEVPKRYVLIIDEINRGNMSKVFGELITLLEDDKRLGAENELTVTLPTGERGFGVPPNLYIIGTMNTADKSVAMLDIALRRRFVFNGVYPDPTLLNSKAGKVLERINDKLAEMKKGSDLLIGHAYFFGAKEAKDIQRAMNQQVIPLLYEYFAGREMFVKEVLEAGGFEPKLNSISRLWEV